MYFSIDIQCTSCGTAWDDIVLREEKDRTDFPCPECEEKKGRRIMSVPNHMKRALPDGQKRPGFQKLREQDKIEREMENTRSSKERFQLAQERDKIYQKKT